MADEGKQTSGDAWGDPISEKRQAELRVQHARQTLRAALPEAERGASAFIFGTLTGADVYWLTKESGGRGSGVPDLHLESANIDRAHLENAFLREAHLEGVYLKEAHLEGADLSEAHLEGADLTRAHLGGARLEGARLEGDHLEGAHLERADLSRAHLENAVLRVAHLEGAYLKEAHLKGADLGDAHLKGANLTRAHLEGARLYEARLEGADLSRAHLEGANLSEAHLEGANLSEAHLEGANLSEAHLEGANLTSATFDKTSHVNAAVLTGVSLDQVTFDGVNLTVIDWSLVPVLGDELTARQAKYTVDTNFYKIDTYFYKTGEKKRRAVRLQEFNAAVRANRVLAVTLRGQGMNEEADRYAYRAQLLQRRVLRLRRSWGAAFGSWLLDVVSGYGYQPMRSVFTYVFVVVAFAATYFILGGAHGALSWNEALVVSMTAFHGRGFFGSAFQPGDPQAAVAAVEALIGLLIEITFIATFTQRFFSR